MITHEQRLRMLARPTGLVDMVLDTDAYNEIDDQFAIAYAMHAPERLNVRALYAAPFFNERSTGAADGMERSYHEIKKLLTLSGQAATVLRGSAGYLSDETTPLISPAAQDLAGRAMAYSPEKPLYVVAIGAITNIASALLLAPAIADRIVIVWLGGHALHWHDNEEFNCKQDVAAARVVYASGAPLVMLPCQGVVSAFTTTEPELRQWLVGKNDLCTYLAEHTIEAANEYAKGQVWSRVIWDVTAIGWLMNDQNKLMLDKLIPTPIPTYDHHWAFDPRRPLCRYVYYIQRDALLADLIHHIAR
ncbi:MAG: nucleoside hydrolase [Oscillospiraceae bacterium]|jgi:inosine-uridine nucleoside N-ribohydrolase|nr:nucleoside hydrolase [Oscillospiraceae bacterium]